MRSVKRVVQTREPWRVTPGTRCAQITTVWPLIMGIHQSLVPIIGCVCSRAEWEVKGAFEVICLNFAHVHFRPIFSGGSPQRSERGCLLFGVISSKKMLNFIGHYYSLEISLVEPRFMNQSHKCFFRLLPLQNLYWFFNVLNHAALKSDYD